MGRLKRWLGMGVGLAGLMSGCEASGPAGPHKDGAGAPAATSEVATPPAASPESAPGEEAGPLDRKLPTLAEEQKAKVVRESQRAKKSGLPTLEDERRAQQAREPAKAPVKAAPGDQPAAKAAVPLPATPTETATPTEPSSAAKNADTYLPAWWLETPKDADGLVTVAARADGASLREARRGAIDAARAKVAEVLGKDAQVPEVPANSTAVRLSSGQYRVFVLVSVKRK